MVCRAAAKMRLQSKHVRLTVIATKQGTPRKSLAGNLIAHLIVLMGPHILADGCRPGIKGHDLQPLCPFVLPGEGIKKLTGIHLLHYGAELRALDGRKTGKTLVTGKGLHRGAVILLQHIVKPLRFIGILAAENRRGDSLVFEHHGEVDDVCFVGPFVERMLPAIREGAPIGALFLENPGEIEQPILFLALPEEADGDERLKPAGFSPVKEPDGAVFQQIVIILQRPVNDIGDALVTGALVINRQCF